MSASSLAIIFGVLAVLFPSLTLILVLLRRPGATKHGDGFAELKGSVLFLQTAFPTILLILTALGFGSYPAIINEVTGNVSENLQIVQIDSLVSEIETLNKRAHEASKTIEELRRLDRERILEIANESLPKGTIIPYWGDERDIDYRYWAICNGKNNTPDLRKKFIIGADFDSYRKSGGNISHSHNVHLNLDNSEIIEGQAVRAWVQEVEPRQAFRADRHEHSIEKQIDTEMTEYLPPHMNLIFLIKIK